MLSKKHTLCLFVHFIITSCSGPDQPVNRSGNDYFPLESGQQLEFNIEKTRFATDGQVSSKHYYIRQRTGKSFGQANGQPTFPLSYDHQEPDQRWYPDSASVTWQTISQTFAQETGQPVIKITSPVYDGMSWDVNAYNQAGKRLCKVKDFGKPYRCGALYFPNTVTIVRQDDSTLLSKNKYIEIYAQNVGLILRERINLQYCYTPDCLGKGVINSGSRETIIIQKFEKQ
ncbi:MAG: hypothetical protein ABIN80_15735 [Dyadobacter sp.]|uniref:hypothetical protein n=1 Tax=Dyadobacter sp. TaxID=1914288 RepID=UPI003267DECF